MKHMLPRLMALTMALLIAATAYAAAVEIRLKDGSKWRGQINDAVEVRFLQGGVEIPLEGKLIKAENLFIQVETLTAGKTAARTIYKSDIVSIKTVGVAAPAVPPVEVSPTPAKPDVAPKPDQAPVPAAAAVSANDGGKAPEVKADASLGVFVLPLKGTVGETFRHEELKYLAEYIDKKYGPGQVIVLIIDSNGGSAPESETIARTIFEIRNRHRVIAWVHKAISAGCSTAMCANEIYFMTEGTAGSVTTWNPGTGQSIKGEELRHSIEHLEWICEQSGLSPYVAAAMKTNPALLSYDRNPETGEVTFYNDLSGEFVLSKEDENLCFNASNALHCGFSDGTADTEAELAKLLNMPKWIEKDDYGREIAEKWEKTCKVASEEIPLAFARYQYKNTSTGDQVVVLGTRVRIIQDLIRWWEKCHNVCEMMGLPPKDDLERQIAQLKKQIADIRKQQNNN